MTKRILLSLILWGGVVFSAFAYDFSQTEEHGQTLYYTITSNVEPYTVKVTYPNASASYNGQAYGTYGSYFTKPSGEISIPNSVLHNSIEYTITAIDKWTFYNCSDITSIIIPNGVTSIGDYSFNGCSSLTAINIPNNVTTIDQYSFNGCTSLEELTIGTGVKTLGNYVFQGCTGLKNITLNATITNVPTSSYAFKSCSCKNACTVTIGPAVTSIPKFTFSNLTNVKTVYFNATNCDNFPSDSQAGMLPDFASTGGTIIIGDDVTEIPAYLCYFKSYTAHIIIGSSVENIGAKAFYNSTSIVDIISKPATPPTLASDTYYSGTKTYPVYVPSGSKSSYQAATNWSSFTNYKEFFEFTTPYSIGGNLISNGYSILLSGAASITIENTGSVICDNILGATPENLIIEDGGQLICNNAVQATVKKEINGVGQDNWDAGSGAKGWYFIASPVNGSSFSTVTTGDYDLYMLDWANEQWLNQKNDEHSELFANGFQRGTGYLYANKEDLNGDNSLSFTGEIQPLSSTNDATVTLAVDGWNLIGNPLTCKVTVDKAFSELNDEGSGLINKNKGSAINPCQGIAVFGEEGDVVTFTKYEPELSSGPSNNNSLQMTLSQTVTTRGTVSSKVVDNAIVNFDGNSTLPKFNMIEGNAKIFIPQNGEDYAIVFSNRQGEMPLNFKAKEFGTYTINFDGTDLNNIKLIDKLENLVIDLNENNSYTFIGSPADSQARFIIRFDGSNNSEFSENSDIFAYQSGNEIVVTGEGELQIFDVMGRKVMTQHVSGVQTVNVNAQGVYIMKLNGKTQKIVVR